MSSMLTHLVTLLLVCKHVSEGMKNSLLTTDSSIILPPGLSIKGQGLALLKMFIS